MKKKRLEIGSINQVKMIIVAFSTRTLFPVAFRLFTIVIRYFFFPQFQTKMKPSIRRVVSVDHPLDETIMFEPKHIKLYLSFIPLWMRSLYFVYRMYGKEALPLIREFLMDLADLYREAGSIYLMCQSTTKRPIYKKNFHFRMVHLTDPHYHCVPSLHVMVVLFNYYRIGSILDTLNKDGTNLSAEKQYLWKQAVSISETILFVKQHSVNCIPAALFALTNIRPEFFNEAEAIRFTDALFTILGSDLESKYEIRLFIKNLYHEFLLEQKQESDYKQVILNFLHNYLPQSAENDYIKPDKDAVKV